MILMTPLRREMGLKSLTLLGLCTLGISVMNELLMASRLRLPLKKSKHKVYMSSFIMFQHFFIKSPLKPSGPRALSGGMCLITSSMSRVEKDICVLLISIAIAFAPVVVSI